MGLAIFTPRSPAVIGLDVDNSSIKMVELSRTNDGLRLERYAIENLPAGAFSDHVVTDQAAVTDALLACRKKLGSKIKNAAAAVPHSSIVTMRLRVNEDIRDGELDLMVMSEAADKVKTNIDQTFVDYQMLEFIPGVNGDPGEKDMLIAACIKERVEERVALVEAAGLKALIIDSDLMAILDAVEKSLLRQDFAVGEKMGLIIDMTPHSSHFYFVSKGNLVYEREHAFGTEQLTQEIASNYEVEMDTANRIRVGAKRVDDVEPLNRAMENFVEVTAQETQRAVQLFITSTNHSSVDFAVLLGHGVALPDMAGTLERVLNVPCQIGNPFAGMKVSANVDSKQLSIDAPALAAACGLALRRFDK